MLRHRTFAIACLLALVASTALAKKPTITFELVMEKGFPFSDARKWSRMFREMRLTVTQIRGVRAGDRTNIRASGRGASKRYRVIGALTAKGRLDIPGASIRYGDRKKLSRWIERLQNEGVEGIATVRGAFGLSPKQLLRANELLSRKVISKTKGLTCGASAKQIIKTLPVKVTIDSAARSGLASSEKMIDELAGLSSGTALAACLRPIGLSLVPRVRGGRVQFAVVDSKQTKQRWPVGWPTKKSPARTLPSLFRFLNVKIDKIPLKNALAAIQKRVKAPMLFDRNRITLRRVDLDKPVSFPQKRTYYKRIIDSLLFQAKLKAEMRVDEANKSFLWITTIRQ